MVEWTAGLYAELAKAIGAEALEPDADGGIELSVGDATTIAIFAEAELALMLVAPIAPLPRQIDYGTALWLLRRNLFDSPVAPFRVACDAEGNLVLWGRIPADDLTGEQLAKLVDALAGAADAIREEVAAGDEAQA